MKIKTISFVVAAAVAALFAGCEWTSSDGNPTWSGGYNEGGDMVKGMNFSGTYRNDGRGGCAVMTKSGDASSTPVVSSGNKVVENGEWKRLGSTTISLSQEPDPSSVSVTAYPAGKPISWINAGNGVLNGSDGSKGKVDGYTVVLFQYEPQGKDGDLVVVSYIPKDKSSAPVVSGSGAVVSITVSQSGSNLKLHASNGVTMSGAITTVNVYSNANSVTYSAQFSASSSGNSIVGTIDDRTGQNRLDATWTSGASVYDVNGFCPTGAGSASAE